ncbi:MAG: hypothetical protein EXS50_02415 [Candidatus Taylorbacteria bacterium]|nr:hypothetical protein [Candidatus Taylorbacteria bacterium]
MKRYIVLAVAIFMAVKAIGQTAAPVAPSPVPAPVTVQPPPHVSMLEWQSKPMLERALFARVEFAIVWVRSASQPSYLDPIIIPVGTTPRTAEGLAALVANSGPYPLEYTDVKDPVSTFVRYVGARSTSQNKGGESWGEELFRGQKEGQLKVAPDGTAYLPLDQSMPTIIPTYRIHTRVPANVTKGFLVGRDENGQVSWTEELGVQGGETYLPSQMAGNGGSIVWTYVDANGKEQKIVQNIRTSGSSQLGHAIGNPNANFEGVRVIKEKNPLKILINPKSENGVGQDDLIEVTYTTAVMASLTGQTSEGEVARGFWVYSVLDVGGRENYYPATPRGMVFVPFNQGIYHVVADWVHFFDPTFDSEQNGGPTSVGMRP